MTFRGVSDPSGQLPLDRPPAALRSLSPRQQTALRAYPIVPATILLGRRIERHRGEFSAEAAGILARVLLAAARALEQIRDLIVSVPIDVQLQVAVAATLARSLGSDVRARAGLQTGSLLVILPVARFNDLLAIESWDSALVPMPPSPAMADLPTTVTRIIDELTFQQGA